MVSRETDCLPFDADRSIRLVFLESSSSLDGELFKNSPLKALWNLIYFLWRNKDLCLAVSEETSNPANFVALGNHRWSN